MRVRAIGVEVNELPRTLLSLLMVPVIFSTLLVSTACPVTQTDIQKAEQIISEVIQAIPLALQLVAAFGTTVPSAVSTNAQKYAQQALVDAQLAQRLLAQYQQSAGATIPSKINAALTDAQANLSAILTSLHIVDQRVVAAVQGSFGAIVGAVATVEALVAAMLSKSVGRQKAAKAHVAMTAKSFKKNFNAAQQAAGHPELSLK